MAGPESRGGGVKVPAKQPSATGKDATKTAKSARSGGKSASIKVSGKVAIKDHFGVGIPNAEVKGQILSAGRKPESVTGATDDEGVFNFEGRQITLSRDSFTFKVTKVEGFELRGNTEATATLPKVAFVEITLLELQ